MAFRATASVTIAFGLVAIPVKIYVSASDENVSFNQLTPNGNRIKQQLIDSVTGEVYAADKLEKGYEFANGQYIKFTKDELDALSLESTKTVEITEFVDQDSIDFIQVEKTYYLGPDKGGDKGYALLSDAMKAEGKVAVAQWASKGKEHLVVIKPYRGGLVLQILFYASEVRPFDQIEVRAIPISGPEREMAAKLLSTLVNDEFDISTYEDRYAKAVREAVDAKIAGQEITIAQDAPVITTVDLFEALKKSILAKPRGKKAAKKGKKVQ